MLKKNDRFIGTCTDINEDGLGIVKHEGFCFFVKDCLPDEVIEAHVVSLKKNYGFAIVKNFIEKSKSRVNPPCSVYKKCGGCQLQHMNYESQLIYKQKHVKDCMQRIGKIDVDTQHCLGMENPFEYRNKVQVPIQYNNGELKIGFYRKYSHDIVEYDYCIVQTKLQNEIISQFKHWLIEEDCAQFFRHLLIKHAHNTNELMLVFVVKEYPFKNVDKIVDKCVQSFPQCQSILVNINTREDNVILGNEEVVLYKNKTIKETLDDCIFNISSKSFYQINPIQTKVLYNKAIELANITKDDVVADVYCGTGTIGIFAAKYARKVIGIEIVASAVEDAKINAKANNVNNIEFICGDAGKCTQILADQNTSIDVAIVDPPRKGLDVATIEALQKMNPSRLVYVSCNPATLARDCSLLSKSYKIKYVQPVDMFPMTTHVETVVLLHRVK